MIWASTLACLGCSGEDPARKATVPLGEPKARLEQLAGDVKLKRAAGDDWTAPTEGGALYENDKLRTAKGASARLRFTNGSSLTLAENALISIAETKARPGVDRTDVTVLKGQVAAELQDSAHQPLSVATPSATVRAGREIVFQ